MTPVQWLIDGLRTVQNQGPVLQIIFVVAIVAAVFLILAWVKRTFRRGFQEIKRENKELKKQAENIQENLHRIHRESAGMQREHEALQTRLPEAVLSLVEKEISDGNHKIAMMKLHAMFDDLSPGLAACCSRLSDLAGGASADDAERYR